MDMNKGYKGFSMSKRAARAYEDGEMPKSKWTKAAMLGAIDEYCRENDLALTIEVGKMRKEELFAVFFYNSSWHHTSKMCNAVDFYALDTDAVDEVSRSLTAAEIEERDAAEAAAEMLLYEQEAALAAARKAADEDFAASHRGISRRDVQNVTRLMEAYPELFGGFKPSKKGKAEVADAGAFGEGVTVIADWFGNRFSRYVEDRRIIEALEAAC